MSRPIISSMPPPPSSLLAHAPCGGWYRRAGSVAQVKAADVPPDLVRVLRLQGHADVRLQPSHAGARVVANAVELVAEDRLLGHQRRDRIGQLDLAAGAARGRL